jgi:hypothetical protein
VKRAAALAALALTFVGPAGSRPVLRVPALEHAVLVVFENHSYSEVIGNPEAPRINRLAARYSLATRYYAARHPSLPNYLALVSGSTQGIEDDCDDCRIDAQSMADTVENAGLTWKAYAESIPSTGYTGYSAPRYAKWHVPFLYFDNILKDSARLGRIVGLGQFRSDLRRNDLPSFALVIPNLCHDMHDCPVSEGDRWLAGFLAPLLASPAMQHSAVFIAFDEGFRGDVAGGGGHVAALVLGPLVRPGARATARTGHYGLLRTIEDGLGLPALGQSVQARPIVGVWRKGISG